MRKYRDALGLFDSLLSISLTVGGFFVAIGGGVLSYFIANASNWMAENRPWSSFLAGLIGAGMVSFVFLAIAAGRRFWIRSNIENKFSERSTVNPTKRTSENERIFVHDLANPITGRIEGKQFSRCEILGPANLVFIGAGQMNKSNLEGCDLIAIKEGALIHNAIVMEDCSLVECTVYRCTLLGPKIFLDKMAAGFCGQLPIISTDYAVRGA